MIPDSDNGYLLGGSSSSGISGEKSEGSKGELDYWIIKIAGSGNKQWDKVYGGDKSDNLVAIIATQDEGYLLGGQSNSGKSGDKTEPGLGSYDFWIVKSGTVTAKQNQTILLTLFQSIFLVILLL